MEDKLPQIVSLLQNKAVLKQHIHRATKAVFDRMKAMTEAMAAALSEHFATVDPSVVIAYDEIGEFEFSLRISGDMMIFQMQTDVQTFWEGHLIMQSDYVKEDERRGYFGSIVAYNFMSNSIKYNRLSDAGYLLARMFLNGEGHFHVEGLRDLYFQFPNIAANVMTDEILRDFIQGATMLAIETDLIAPAYQEVQVVALGDKLQDQMAGAAKVGFQMKTEAKPKAN